MIYEKIDEEAKALSDSFNAEREKQVDQLKKELEARRAKELDRASKEAGFRANEVTARERAESRKQVMQLRESLIQQTVEDLKSRLRSFTESAEYGGFLRELALRIIKKLQSGSYIVYLAEADMGRYAEAVKSSGADARPDCSFEVRASAAAIIGGLVVEDAGRRFMLDGSFSALIEDSRHYAGLKVSEILGQGGAAVWDQETEG